MVMLLSVILLVGAGGIFWAHETEENCWRQEGAVAVEKYEKLKTRADVLRVTSDFGLETSGSNPFEVIEKDPNGCSLGSNGRTVVRLYFNSKDELQTIQVFRDYFSAPDYEMELIEEKKR